MASGPLSKLALPLAFSCAHPRNNRGGVREGTRGGGIGVDAPLPCRLPSLQYLKLALLTLLDLPELTPLPSLQYLKLAPCSLQSDAHCIQLRSSNSKLVGGCDGGLLTRNAWPRAKTITGVQCGPPVAERLAKGQNHYGGSSGASCRMHRCTHEPMHP